MEAGAGEVRASASIGSGQSKGGAQGTSNTRQPAQTAVSERLTPPTAPHAGIQGARMFEAKAQVRRVRAASACIVCVPDCVPRVRA